MNEMWRSCAEWMTSFGWVGGLLVLLVVAAFIALVFALVRQTRTRP